MKYTNPIIHADISDPDVIRVGSDFYMVCSSANLAPAIPVMHSENLVEWRLINYVLPEIPFEGYDEVKHGGGTSAPSIRYHNGKFYCLVPFTEEGIFVSVTENPYGEWSPLRPLIVARDLKTPAPYGSTADVL